jgi:hypothetical protein
MPTIKTAFSSKTCAITPIPADVALRMRGKSLPESAPMETAALAYIRPHHYGFDGKIHTGEIIVNRSIAAEVCEIFDALLAAKYPIEKIRLIDDYGADDEKSMSDNNSSAFCWRSVPRKSSLSWHALGLAIDINPKMNPYVSGDVILPKNATAYVRRDQDVLGLMRDENDAAVKIFKNRGWIWGGNYQTLKDWQHFEKPDQLMRNYYLEKIKGSGQTVRGYK